MLRASGAAVVETAEDIENLPEAFPVKLRSGYARKMREKS
ncbi:hypothetical protein AGRO_2160 [Agrobacterium sp. ATCC 31749]|nr:hypothetical protein AGRO_2160 [Agrobacterium sp. ATCC 31749]